MIPTIWYSRKGKTMKTIKRLVVARGEGRDMNRQSKEDKAVFRKHGSMFPSQLRAG